MAAEVEAELTGVLATLRALPVHSPAGTALAQRAGELRHRLAAARAVVDAYAVEVDAAEVAAA